MLASLNIRKRATHLGEFPLVVLGLIVALIITAFILLASGTDPLSAYDQILHGSIFGRYNFGETLMVATPLVLAGLAALVPFTAGLWNVGGDGQLYAGAIATCIVALELPHWPGPIMIVISLLAGAFGGAFWGGIAGFLKARYGANEVIVTLMLQLIILNVADYVITGPWALSGSTQTRAVPVNDQLGIIWSGTSTTWGLFIAIGAIASTWFLLRRTTFGLALRALGHNRDASEFLGFPVRRLVVGALSLGGAFAGLAGAILVLGVLHALEPGLSDNYGFLGIAIALLARLRPGGVFPASLFLAMLTVGGSALAAGTGSSSAIAMIMEGAFVLTLVAVRGARQSGAVT